MADLQHTLSFIRGKTAWLAVWGTRFLAYGLVAATLLLIVGYRFARTTVTPQFVKDHLVKAVQQQTGGKLTIGNVQVELSQELKITGVKFYPPVTDTGYIEGGEVAKQPLLAIDQISMRYDLKRILAGQLFLKEVRLKHPSLYLTSIKNQSNVMPIILYRARKFPAEKVDPPEGNSANPLTLPPEIFQLKLSKRFMPLNITFQNIGFDQLSVTQHVSDGQGSETFAKVENLSLAINGHWFGRSSIFGVNVFSSFEKPLQLTVRNNQDEVLSSQIAQSHTVQFKDFQEISVALALLSPKTVVQKKPLENIGGSLQSFIKLSEDWSRVNIENLRVSVLEALNYQLTGQLELSPNRASDQSSSERTHIVFELSSRGQLALAELKRHLLPFAPDLELAGSAQLNRADISGQFAVADLFNILNVKLENLPSFAVDTALHNVTMVQPKLAGCSDLSGSLNIDGQADASLEDYKLTLSAALDTPSVQASLNNHVVLNEPLLMKTHAALALKHMQLKFDHHLSFSDLLTSNVELKCSNQCDKVDVTQRTAISSLGKLWLLAKPVAEMLAPSAPLPNQLSGAVQSQGGMSLVGLEKLWRGVSKDTTAVKSPHIESDPAPDSASDLAATLNQLDMSMNQSVTVKNLSVAVDQLGLKLEGADTSVKLRGYPQAIHFDSQVDVGGFAWEQTPDTKLSVAGVHVGTSLKVLLHDQTRSFTQLTGMAIRNEQPILQLLKGSQVVLNHKTKVSRLSSKVKNIQETMRDLAFEAVTDISDGQFVKVSPLQAELPDLGFRHEGLLTASLNEQFIPTDIVFKASTRLDSHAQKQLPLGVSLAGSISNDVDVRIQDLNLVTINAATHFDRFELTVRNLLTELAPKLTDQFAFLKKPEHLLRLQNVTGHIPLNQRFLVGKLMAGKLTNKESAKISEKSASTTGVKSGEETASETGAKTGPNNGPETGAEARAGTGEMTEGERKNVAPGADALVVVPSSVPSLTTAIMQPEEAVQFYETKYHNGTQVNTNVRKYVDYSGVANLMETTSGIHIDRIDVLDVAIDHFDLGFEIADRRISVNQFMLHTLGGVVQGAMHFDFDFDDVQRGLVPRYLRLASHVTNLDTNLLVASQQNQSTRPTRTKSTWQLFSEPKISGTAHVNYDVQNNDLGGNIEITSIGKEQMRTFLRYIDPYNQNTSIRDMRRALLVGDVRHVAIPVKNGQIDLAVDVRAVGVPIPLPKVSRFPLSQMLANALHAKGVSKDQSRSDPQDQASDVHSTRKSTR